MFSISDSNIFHNVLDFGGITQRLSVANVEADLDTTPPEK
jgi:hypothetical protein